MTSGNKERRMHRKTADRLLAGAIERAKDINADGRYCYTIEKMVVFGSYVNTDRDDLGDLDIAVQLVPRYVKKEDPHWEEARSRYQGGDYLMRQIWPMEEVMRRLKNRSAYISIHRLGRTAEQDEIIYSDTVITINLGGSE